MVEERITSTANPRVKAYAKLKTARDRRNSGLFLIEGRREVARALAAGITIETLLICPELLTKPLLAPPEIETVELAPEPMAKVAMRENPPGSIAVARQFDTRLASLKLTPSPLILIAEQVEKPGNLGAMMRTADAVGADAVVVADAATDVFNPNVVRASQGALFTVPLAVASSAAAIAWAAENEIVIVGGYPSARNELWNVKMTGPLALLIGAEDVGISSAWSNVATPVRIPMAGSADSLNASVSAAVLLFEAVRQRRTGLLPAREDISAT